jgi:hypothetical protein
MKKNIFSLTEISAVPYDKSALTISATLLSIVPISSSLVPKHAFESPNLVDLNWSFEESLFLDFKKNERIFFLVPEFNF